MAQGGARPSPLESDPAGMASLAPVSGRPRPFLLATSDAAAAGSQKVVPLVAEQVPADDDPEASPADWLNALQQIRDVGAQVRRERDLAQEIVQHSQSLIQRTIVQAEEAERRAEAAEAEASEAVSRAERAEERARLAEVRAQHAEERAHTAEAGEKEARLWLRRLHAGLKTEFDSLTIIGK